MNQNILNWTNVDFMLKHVMELNKPFVCNEPIQDKPLDLSITIVEHDRSMNVRTKRKTLKRKSKEMSTILEMPIDLSQQNKKQRSSSSSSSSGVIEHDHETCGRKTRQGRIIKRPKKNQDFETNLDWEDDVLEENSNDDPDYDAGKLNMNRSNFTNNKRKNKRKLVTKGKMMLSDDDNDRSTLPKSNVRRTEPGETVIMGLRCTADGCGEMLPSRDILNRHLLYRHSKFPYQCLAPTCKAEFQIMGELGPHVRDQHGNIGSWHCAHKCGRSFPTHRGLRHHLWYYHLEGRFACPIGGCKFEAKLPIEVKQHRYRVHSPEFKCMEPECGRVFKQHSNLLRHGRCHSGSKPYRCAWKQCTYSSEVRSHVIRHVRAKHLRVPNKRREERNNNEHRSLHDSPESFVRVLRK